MFKKTDPLERTLAAAPRDIRRLALSGQGTLDERVSHAIFVLGTWGKETRDPEARRLSDKVAALRE